MIEVKDYTSRIPNEKIAEVLTFALGYLGLDGIRVVIAVNAPLLKRLSTKDTDFEAMLIEGGTKHSYILYVLDDLNISEMMRILCHEAAHIAQMERGDLSMDTRTFRCTWKGIEYDKSYPYLARPWEKEAFKVQNTIFKKYRKSIKSKKQ